MLKLLTRHRLKFGLGLVLGLTCIALLVIHGGQTCRWIAGISQVAIAWLQEAPAPLFYLGTALIPLIGIPIAPFYMAAGAAYGLVGCMLGVGLALLLNLTLSYWIARFLRGPIERWLAKAGWKIPQVPQGQYLAFTIMVRLTPGAPLMVQNYILGLSGTPFRTYLLVSWCAEMCIACGYILTGESLYARSWSFLFAGIGLIVFVILLAHFLRATVLKNVPPEIQIDKQER